ncbi:MAG: bacteriocin family protein, partial [Actinomycetota bacterium]|nr:bacteriocin family protein [Actinomycetota bacterium]
MSDDVPRLPWTDEQWATIQRVVQEAAGKARVASSFLPLVGPLPPGQTTVPALTMDPATLETDDWTALRLTTIACNVSLTTQQAEDPDLAAARQMLARAAEGIGRLEDAIVFNGQPGPDTAPDVRLEIGTVRGGQGNRGLVDIDPFETIERTDEEGIDSLSLVSAIAAAIQRLEEQSHYGPFACVLGHELFLAANSPEDSLAFPSDRILPFLEGGPLRRASVIPPDVGIVVALAGSPVDLVVGSDVHVKFLQLTTEPRYVLRVSERFV